ncbi:MAG: hypothetical protein CMI13_12440 [Oleibacter sp.]|nr:hypothetical protein [Thalassolituus sp.]
MSDITQQQFDNWRIIQRRLQDKKLLQGKNAAISVRIPGSDQCWFAPVTEQSPELARITTTSETGDQTSDDSLWLHQWLYAQRTDISAIVSASGEYGAYLARLSTLPDAMNAHKGKAHKNTGMPGIFDEQVRHLGIMRAPANNLKQASSALQCNGNLAILFGQNIVMGMTANRLILNAELFEKSAKAYVLAAATGGQIKQLPWLVRFFANRRLLKDQKRAREAIAMGRLPDESRGY